MKRMYFATAVVAAVTSLSLMSCSRDSLNSGPQKVTLSEDRLEMQVAQAAKLREEAKAAAREGDDKTAAHKNSAADELDHETAEDYARIGELLLMPEGFEYADRMFGRALKLNPNQPKALLYKAVTEPAMTLRGFIPRIERVITDKKALAKLEELREDVKKYKMPELTRFATQLPADAKPFVTYYDVQRFQREVLLPAVLSSLEKLNRIDASKPLKLNFTPERVEADATRTQSYTYSQYCSTTPDKGWSCQTYQYSYSERKLPNEYFVDKHDLTIIRNVMLGLAHSIRLGTAYSFKDSEYAIRRIQAVERIRKNQRRDLSVRDVVDVLREYPELFVLEKDQQLAEIAKSTSEALKQGLELHDMRSELCEGNSRTEENALIRPICLAADAVDTLQLGIDMLAGPTSFEIGRTSQGMPVKVLVDVARTLQNPPQDLKTLLPTHFDKNGDPVQYPDPTMGGLFPNGDIIEKIKETAQGFRGLGVRIDSGAVDDFLDIVDDVRDGRF